MTTTESKAPKSLLDSVDDAAFLRDATFAAFMAAGDDGSCGKQVTDALRWLTARAHDMAADLHRTLDGVLEADNATPAQPRKVGGQCLAASAATSATKDWCCWTAGLLDHGQPLEQAISAAMALDAMCDERELEDHNTRPVQYLANRIDAALEKLKKQIQSAHEETQPKVPGAGS